jgi:hypothetical protein
LASLADKGKLPQCRWAGYVGRDISTAILNGGLLLCAGALISQDRIKTYIIQSNDDWHWFLIFAWAMRAFSVFNGDFIVRNAGMSFVAAGAYP